MKTPYTSQPCNECSNVRRTYTESVSQLAQARRLLARVGKSCEPKLYVELWKQFKVAQTKCLAARQTYDHHLEDHQRTRQAPLYTVRPFELRHPELRQSA